MGQNLHDGEVEEGVENRNAADAGDLYLGTAVAKKLLGSAGAVVVTAVSYTHLDVYKRQTGHSPRRRNTATRRRWARGHCL